jgi:hypothetical protein
MDYFKLFTRTIASVPAKAVIKLLDLECHMLQSDFEHDRLAASEDANSVLFFWRFVQMAKCGEVMHGVRPLPPDHIEFYKETIVRLIHANELPSSAMEQFDHAFQIPRRS